MNLKPLNRISLQIRILVLTILAATTVLIVIEYITNWHTVTALENEVGGQINSAAKKLTEKLQLYPLDEIPGRFKNLLIPLRRKIPNVIRMDVYANTNRGLSLITSNVLKERVLEDFEMEALKSGKAKTYMIEPEAGKRRIVTVRPIQFKDGNKGIVTLICSLKPFKQLLAIHSGIRNYSLTVTVIVLVIVISWLFQSSIYRNIRHLVNIILRFRKGDTAARTKERLPGEFGELARHLNEMFEEISQFQKKLQNKVKEATYSLSRRNRELSSLNMKFHEMQKKLTHAERLAVIGQLTTTFAHEIGSPMSAVSTHLQMLTEEPLPGEIKQRIHIAYSQLDRICNIVEKLLASTHLAKTRQRIDLREIIYKVSELMRPVLEIKEVELQVIMGQEDLTVAGDSEQLQQMFINLFNNALDAIGKQGTIEVKAHEVKMGSPMIEIQFLDTGSGITRDKIESIFEPFFTTKEIGRGTGLGLAVCKEIVLQHQGTIQVESVPGKTIFTILLPMFGSETDLKPSQPKVKRI